MTLSLALNNALSGLRSASTQADLIANNVSNALTPGYARREAILSPAIVGGEGLGVQVTGVLRAANPVATESRRLAEASFGDADLKASVQNRLANVIGEPGAPNALATAADRLDAALAAAGDTPESAPLLNAAARAAADYVSSVNAVAAAAATLRTEADASIAKQVTIVNGALKKVQSINAEISAREISGGDTSALQDQREGLVREISSLIPLKSVKRDGGQIALFAKNGAQLLDGRAAELSFSPTRVVTPDLTVGSGSLSGIALNGSPIPIGQGGDGGLLDGGSLSAAFEVRDVILPAFAADLDAFAADLITRTQGLVGDPTLGAGDAGLFTDAGAAFAPSEVVGLASRLQLNPAVDISTGGDPSFLREGLLSTAPGDPGQNGVLRAIQDALLAPTSSSGSLTGEKSAAGFAAEISSRVISDAFVAEETSTFRLSQLQVLQDAETSMTGVDTDQELSRLLVVEQAYAASAKVVEVIDQLMERLTRL